VRAVVVKRVLKHFKALPNSMVAAPTERRNRCSIKVLAPAIKNLDPAPDKISKEFATFAAFKSLMTRTRCRKTELLVGLGKQLVKRVFKLFLQGCLPFYSPGFMSVGTKNNSNSP
jgi:hypothetical protein